jgi:hypothetical protein
MFILDKLKITSKEFKSSIKNNPEHPKLIALIELSDFSSRRFLESQDKKEIFICFIIKSFIENIQNNFGIDTAFDEIIKQTRASFYKNIPKFIDNIILAIEKENTDLLVDNFCEFLADYSNKINHLNNGN